MKKVLLSTVAILAMSGAAFAQTTGGAGANDQSFADAGESASAVNTNDSASARVNGESASASLADFTGTRDVTRSSASVGDDVIARAFGNGVGAGDVARAQIRPGSGGEYNQNVQFQVGNDNTSINMQVGTFQESATIQLGDANTALISQRRIANEAAISQVGDMNNTALVQDGVDNAAAAAAYGTMNTSFGLQVGGDDNILASAQAGSENSAVTFQKGNDNTAATLQEGTGNQSFINQGNETVNVELAAINGDRFGGGLPTGAIVSGSSVGSLGAVGNSAASLQLGANNRSAIVQTGSGNEAVNYQSNR